MKKIKSWFKEYEELLKAIGCGILITAIIVIGVLGIEYGRTMSHNKSVAEIYNDGICPKDNTYYELRAVTSDWRYIYVCPECHGEVEIYK